MSTSVEPLQNRLALVTGGSRGIGRSIVVSLAELGIDSILTYVRDRDAAASTVDEVRALGRTATPLHLDVTDASSFEAFADELCARLAERGCDRFDYLVNNAGTSHAKSFVDTTGEELDQLYAAHFKGPYLLTQRLLPMMNDGGRIINISSGLTRFSSPNRAASACMKSALETLTRYLAFELAPRRIAVNTVAPGAIATDFNGGVVRDDPEMNRTIAKATALGRVGLADDIGPVVASLLTPANRWINGQRIEVSGGVHL